jgi:hypothetical protein
MKRLQFLIPHNYEGSTLNHNSNYQNNYQPTFNPIDKVMELFERLLASGKKQIQQLKDILDKNK